MSESEELPAEDFTGPAVLRSGDAEVSAEVTLAGFFQPIDGRFHWHGRVTGSPEVTAAFASGDRVEIDTGRGVAPGKLSDVDPWGRLRVTGTGPPPF